MQHDFVGRALDAHAQRIAGAVAQEVEIGPADLVDELQLVVLRRIEQSGNGIVEHHVAAVAAAEDIGVVALLAGQEVVAGAAVERVGIDHAVDRVVVRGLGVLQHLLHDLREIDAGAVVEDETFNQIRRDIVEPVARAERVGEQAEAGLDAGELPLDDERVAGRLAVVVEEDDLQIWAFAVADQLQIFDLDAVLEAEDVDAGLDRPEREIAEVVDDVLSVAGLEDIDVPAGAAAHVIVALAPPEDVGRTRAHQIVVELSGGALPVEHLHRHAETVPGHAVREHDGADAGIDPLAVAEELVVLAEELVGQANGVGAATDLQDQIFAVSDRLDVGREHVGEAQLVSVAEVLVVDEVVARTAPDEIVIGAFAAAQGLVARGHVEIVGRIGAVDDDVAGRVGDDALVADAERVRDAADVEVDADGLEGRQHHLHDEGLVDRERGAAEIALAGRVVIRIDLRQDAVPLRQVVEHGIVRVAGRRAGEDRLEHRGELAVGRRLVAVGGEIVGEAAEEVLEAALHRDADRITARSRDVLGHDRLQHVDHGRDAGDVMRRIGRQVGAAAGADGIGDVPGRIVELRRQHLGAEIDTAERGREMELRRRQHLDAIGGIVGRVHLVERVEVDRVIAQVEFAGIAGLPFQLQGAVEIARPDVESAVLVGHFDGVVDRDAVGEANADLVDREVGIGVEAELLGAPFGAGGMGEREDGVLAGVAGGSIGGELPAAVGLLDAVVEDDGAPVDDAHQIGRGIAIRWRGVAVGRRPGLLQSPARTGGCRLRQHVLHGGARDRLALRVKHRRAGGERPVAALGILDIDAAVEQHGLAVGVGADQHRRQLARLFQRLAPGAEHLADLRHQCAQFWRRHRGCRGGHELAERDVVGGGDRQVGHPPKALDVERRARLPDRPTGLAGISGVGVVRSQDGVVHAPDGTALEGDVADAGQPRAVGRGDVDRGGAEIDADDAELIERLQLARIGDAVAVEVLPDLQLGPQHVRGRDLAVAIGIELRQLGEAGLPDAAEHLRDVVDSAVAVDVPDQEAVVALQPAGAFGEQIMVDIEIDRTHAEIGRLDAVAIEIDHQRIGPVRPFHALGKPRRGGTEGHGLIDQGIAAILGGNGNAVHAEQRLEQRHQIGDRIGRLEHHAEGALAGELCLLESDVAADEIEVLDLHPALQDALCIQRLLRLVGVARGAAENSREQLVELVGDVHVQPAAGIGPERIGHPRQQMIEIDRLRRIVFAAVCSSRGQEIGVADDSTDAAECRKTGDAAFGIAAGESQTIEFEDVVMLRILDDGVGRVPDVVGVGRGVLDLGRCRLGSAVRIEDGITLSIENGLFVKSADGITPDDSAHRAVVDPVATKTACSGCLFTTNGEYPIVAGTAIEDHAQILRCYARIAIERWRGRHLPPSNSRIVGSPISLGVSVHFGVEDISRFDGLWLPTN